MLKSLNFKALKGMENSREQWTFFQNGWILVDISRGWIFVDIFHEFSWTFLSTKIHQSTRIQPKNVQENSLVDENVH